MFYDCYDYMETRLNSGLHIFVTIVEDVCNNAPKEILKLSTYRLQVYLSKDSKYIFRKINNCDDDNDVEIKPYLYNLNNMFSNMCLRSLRLIWRLGFKAGLHIKYIKQNSKESTTETPTTQLPPAPTSHCSNDDPITWRSYLRPITNWQFHYHMTRKTYLRQARKDEKSTTTTRPKAMAWGKGHILKEMTDTSHWHIQ